MESDDHVAQPMTLADEGFDLTVERYDLMIVDFWAPWCGPCMAMEPVIEELAEEYADRVIFGKLNTDDNPATTERFGIMGIPTLKVFKGGAEIDTMSGAAPKDYVKDFIDKALAK